MSDARATVVIVYGDRSASAMALSEAAASLCDIVWVVDSSQMRDTLIIRLLKRLGRVVDTTGMPLDEVVRELGPQRPAGIVAYADDHIATASALGVALGLDYHDPLVAERLLDKVVQRRAFAEGGLPVPACVPVPSTPISQEIAALVSDLIYPVVLKPRHGAASRETHFAANAAALSELIVEVSSLDPGTGMVVEEFLVGASPPPSSFFGDYVSVESVVCHGRISHLAVTGRLPSAKPFRETGLIIPCDYSPSVVEGVLDAATSAIRAVGIRTGCLHTEVKVTDHGPRVLEVNGRIGGFVAPTLAQACPGTNFFEISLRVALGEDVVFDELLATDRVGYAIVAQPPLDARRVASVEGLDRLAAYPGVESVALSRRPGDEVDWRLGSHEYVFSVVGSAPDHDAVQALQGFIDDQVVITYD